jgi:hypothetical protein
MKAGNLNQNALARDSDYDCDRAMLYSQAYGHPHCAGVLRFRVRFPPRTQDHALDQHVSCGTYDSYCVCPGHRRGGSSTTGTRPSGRSRVRRGGFSAVRSRTSCSIAWAASIGSSCSQILTASQPAAASCVSVSRSRRAMPRNFRRHQLVLVLGRSLCSGQECQKQQPSTNTATCAPATGCRCADAGSHPARAGRRRTASRAGAGHGATPSPAGYPIAWSGASPVKSPATMPVEPGRGRDAGTQQQRPETDRHRLELSFPGSGRRPHDLPRRTSHPLHPLTV